MLSTTASWNFFLHGSWQRLQKLKLFLHASCQDKTKEIHTLIGFLVFAVFIIARQKKLSENVSLEIGLQKSDRVCAVNVRCSWGRQLYLPCRCPKHRGLCINCANPLLTQSHIWSLKLVLAYCFIHSGQFSGESSDATFFYVVISKAEL